ncbi:MAG: hypothetical protein ACRDG6_06145 [Candidatus Limnocylindria bacterium]
MRRARTFVAVLFTFASLASPAIAARPPAPPSLSPGPNFTTFETFNGEIEHLEGLCQPGGTTFEFNAAGIATGPYPGTFTETGTVTIGPASGTDLFNASVVAFESSFRIDSVFEGRPVEVTGTKRLAFVGTGHCADVAAGDPFRSSRIAIVQATYQARIKTSRGTYFDRGAADVRLFEFYEPEDPSVGQRGFSELFISALENEAAKPGKGCGDENHEHIRSSECGGG